MELLSRSAAFVIGLSLVLLFLQSALRVSVVNRQKGDRLAHIVGHVAYATVAHVASRRRTYDRIQDALAWVLPLYVLLLIVVWFVLVEMGFSLMIWSLQAEPSLLRAFIASGSALSTLGFLTPPDLSGQLLAIPEGAFGLGIVVFFFTFIPGYQATVKTRELRVAWLYAPAGPTPTVLPGPASPTVDAIPIGAAGGVCPSSGTVDQRGTARPQAGACDVGSVERNP